MSRAGRSRRAARRYRRRTVKASSRRTFGRPSPHIEQSADTGLCLQLHPARGRSHLGFGAHAESRRGRPRRRARREDLGSLRPSNGGQDYPELLLSEAARHGPSVGRCSRCGSPSPNDPRREADPSRAAPKTIVKSNEVTYYPSHLLPRPSAASTYAVGALDLRAFTATLDLGNDVTPSFETTEKGPRMEYILEVKFKYVACCSSRSDPLAADSERLPLLLTEPTLTLSPHTGSPTPRYRASALRCASSTALERPTSCQRRTTSEMPRGA